MAAFPLMMNSENFRLVGASNEVCYCFLPWITLFHKQVEYLANEYKLITKLEKCNNCYNKYDFGVVMLIETVNEFTKMHDEFIDDWNEAMQSGDTSSVNRMTEEYYVAFFQSLNDKPTFYSKQEAVTGMNQSVMHLLGAKKKFENRVIRFRKNDNAVVFYELLIMKNEEVLARLFTIENWSLIRGKWMIVRETEEPIN